MLFSIDPWPQGHRIKFASMWEAKQWTFQVLPRGVLHSTTICHGIIVQDLSLSSFPTSVKWAHYTDDRMLTCEDLPLQQDTRQVLLEHLGEKESSEPTEN